MIVKNEKHTTRINPANISSSEAEEVELVTLCVGMEWEQGSQLVVVVGGEERQGRFGKKGPPSPPSRRPHQPARGKAVLLRVPYAIALLLEVPL